MLPNESVDVKKIFTLGYQKFNIIKMLIKTETRTARSSIAESVIISKFISSRAEWNMDFEWKAIHSSNYPTGPPNAISDPFFIQSYLLIGPREALGGAGGSNIPFSFLP